MPAVVLRPDDLTPFASIAVAKAEAMIEDAMAMAARVAPCITEPQFKHDAAAKAIIRGAILRWNDAGTGVLQTESAGPFSTTVDTRQRRSGMFWPSEIQQLQELCRDDTPGAFAIDTAPGDRSMHSPICALAFGAAYCSCGADVAGFPLYEA